MKLRKVVFNHGGASGGKSEVTNHGAARSFIMQNEAPHLRVWESREQAAEFEQRLKDFVTRILLLEQ